MTFGICRINCKSSDVPFTPPCQCSVLAVALTTATAWKSLTINVTFPALPVVNPCSSYLCPVVPTLIYVFASFAMRGSCLSLCWGNGLIVLLRNGLGMSGRRKQSATKFYLRDGIPSQGFLLGLLPNALYLPPPPLVPSL
jgi:hypothetical protein